MGGSHTCQLTLRSLDKFAWIGSFSGTGNGLSSAPIVPNTFVGGISQMGFFQREGETALGWDGAEEPDPFREGIGAFWKMLNDAGVTYIYFVSPGTTHEWLTWQGPERFPAGDSSASLN